MGTEQAIMGEAKRTRIAIEKGPCRCGSSKAAGLCCFKDGCWYKEAAVLGLRALPPASSVERCYMEELGTCRGGSSRAHLSSESIILLLKADGDCTVSGLPWLADGETKVLGPKALTANCLCEKHNSALSPLDAAALYFFSGL